MFGAVMIHNFQNIFDTRHKNQTTIYCLFYHTPHLRCFYSTEVAFDPSYIYGSISKRGHYICRFRFSIPSNLMGETMPPYDLLWILFLAVEVHRGTKIHDPKNGEKETKIRSWWRRTIPRCTIGTNIKTKAVHVTSLVKFLRRYGANNKPELPLALYSRWKFFRRRLYWVGEGLLLLQDSTLTE